MLWFSDPRYGPLATRRVKCSVGASLWASAFVLLLPFPSILVLQKQNNFDQSYETREIEREMMRNKVVSWQDHSTEKPHKESWQAH